MAEKLFASALGGISSSERTSVQSEDAALTADSATLSNPHNATITRSEASATFSGADLLVGLGTVVAICATIAIGVMIAFTGGAVTTVEDVVIGLVLGVALFAAINYLVRAVSSALIYQIEGWANNSSEGNQASYQLTWSSIADAISWYVIGLTGTLSTMILWSAWHDPLNVVDPIGTADILGFALAIVGAGFAIYAYTHSDKPAAICGVVLGDLSLVTDVLALSGKSKSPVARQLDWVTLLLDAGTEGLSLQGVF